MGFIHNLISRFFVAKSFVEVDNFVSKAEALVESHDEFMFFFNATYLGFEYEEIWK